MEQVNEDSQEKHQLRCSLVKIRRMTQDNQKNQKKFKYIPLLASVCGTRYAFGHGDLRKEFLKIVRFLPHLSYFILHYTHKKINTNI